MRYLVPAVIISFLAELLAARWTWVRAPTDSLRAYWEGNFSAYLADRLLPWLVFSVLLWLIFFFVHRTRAKRKARQNG
jgi:hypothetical protein